MDQNKIYELHVSSLIAAVVFSKIGENIFHEKSGKNMRIIQIVDK